METRNMMKRLLPLLCLLALPAQAEDKSDKAPPKKKAVEKYSWTLGYKPDKTIQFSEPAEGDPLKLDLFFPGIY